MREEDLGSLFSTVAFQQRREPSSRRTRALDETA
jgi:hypothetical protein